jgi:hypothetical protein
MDADQFAAVLLVGGLLVLTSTASLVLSFARGRR